VKDKIDQLVNEYGQLTTQIIHWDSLSLKKDQFYFAVVGVFLIAVVKVIYDEITKVGTSPFLVVALIVLAGVFNLFMCIVWFKTNRRNREWLDVRFDRAREIETSQGIEFRILSLQDKRFDEPEYEGHATSKLVLYIPIIFFVVWVAVICLSVALYWY